MGLQAMISTPTEKARDPRLWALRSRAVVAPSGVRAAAVLIQDETIVALVAPDQVPDGCPVEDVGDGVILPGVVDTHVHINEPGRTEWEGFETATRAAAAGGVTTLVDMPLNSSPVTTTPEALQAKRTAATGKLWVDCGFYGGVVPGNAAQMEPLLRAGVLGLKAFLCPSGIDEFPNVAERDLRLAMPAVARAGLPLLVHAELPGAAPSRDETTDPRNYRGYLASRPRAWEHDAIRLLINLCREYHCRVHIVHLSSADALPLIAGANAAGLPLTVETCPHYLTFAAEEIPDSDPRFKCAPPLRERDNRERLWEGLKAGLIDTIGSDHSPAPPELKHLSTGDLRRAWGGIASLQLTLPAVWTAAHQRGLSIADVARLMCQRPAELVGLSGRKGQLAPGHDADFVIFDAQTSWQVEGSRLYHRHKLTPYEGRTLLGRVTQTYLRGRLIYNAGELSTLPHGHPLP